MSQRVSKRQREREGGHVSRQVGDGWVVPWGPESSPAPEAATTEPGVTKGSFSLPQRACSKARAAWTLIGAIHCGARGKVSFILHHPLPSPGKRQQKARCPALPPHPIPPPPDLSQAQVAPSSLGLSSPNPAVRVPWNEEGPLNPEGCLLWGLRDPERDSCPCFPFTCCSSYERLLPPHLQQQTPGRWDRASQPLPLHNGRA